MERPLLSFHQPTLNRFSHPFVLGGQVVLSAIPPYGPVACEGLAYAMISNSVLLLQSGHLIVTLKKKKKANVVQG